VPQSEPRLGRYAATHLLTVHPELTALLATSDALALGAIQAARDHGLSVPEQLSIVGFDDGLDARTSVPPLTTIRQPRRDKGRLAGKLIRDLVDERAAGEANLLPAELIVRGSTGPPRTER